VKSLIINDGISVARSPWGVEPMGLYTFGLLVGQLATRKTFFRNGVEWRHENGHHFLASGFPQGFEFTAVESGRAFEPKNVLVATSHWSNTPRAADASG